MAYCNRMSTFIFFLEELLQCAKMLLKENFPVSMLHHKTSYWKNNSNILKGCSARNLTLFIREKWKHLKSPRELDNLIRYASQVNWRGNQMVLCASAWQWFSDRGPSRRQKVNCKQVIWKWKKNLCWSFMKFMREETKIKTEKYVTISHSIVNFTFCLIIYQWIQ